MKKIKFLNILLLSVCAPALAGGGGSSSWSPTVDPRSCIVSKSTNNGAWSWNGTSECNEVIEKGYATGVRYQGYFAYDDGSSRKFDAYITPNSYVAYDHQGKKITGILDTVVTWLR